MNIEQRSCHNFLQSNLLKRCELVFFITRKHLVAACDSCQVTRITITESHIVMDAREDVRFSACAVHVTHPHQTRA